MTITVWLRISCCTIPKWGFDDVEGLFRLAAVGKALAAAVVVVLLTGPTGRAQALSVLPVNVSVFARTEGFVCDRHQPGDD